MERSLILFKPDAVQRRLTGRILSRFEDKGYTAVALKMMRVTPELARRHYAEHVEKPFYPGLERYITSGPILALILEGPEVVRVVRDMVGPTNGCNAAAGTIRGDYSTDGQMNLIHASDSPESAAREIVIFFSAEEIHAYEPTIARWMRPA